MRSSKSRSRNKNNRNNNNRSGVNIVNRVFDSSGPEGKVRGTPQQIIDKYNQLARDAQLSNDRVAAENFQQHAEHYLRLLSEAQREIDAKREQDAAQQAQRDRQHQQNQQNHQNHNNNNNQQGGQQHGGNDQPSADSGPSIQTEDKPQGDQQPSPETPKDEKQPRTRRPRTPRGEQKPRQEAAPTQNDVIDTPSDGDSGLVETPESKPAKPRRSRAKPKAKPEESGDAPAGGSEAAE